MSVLMFALFIFSLLGYCLAARRFLRLPPEFTPFVVISFLISALFVFGYLGALTYAPFPFPSGFNSKTLPQIPLLLYGTYFLLILGLALLGGVVLDGKKSDKKIVDELRHPAILIFFVLAVLIFFPTRYHQVRKFDEIATWASAAKSMMVYDGLAGNDSFILYPSFMPGTTLFEYSIAKLCCWPDNRFAEGYWFYAMALMLLSPCFVLGYGSGGKGRLSFPFTLLAGFLLLFLFQKGLSCILVDSAIAVWFGAILFMYFAQSIDGVSFDRKMIPLIPPLITLILIKQIGIFFAGVIVGVVFVDIALSLVFPCRDGQATSSQKSTGTEPPSQGTGKRLMVSGLVGLLFFLTPIGVWKAWNTRIDRACGYIEYSPDSLQEQVVRWFDETRAEYPLKRWPSAFVNSTERQKLNAAAERALDEQRIDIFRKGQRKFFENGLTRIRIGTFSPLTPACVVILFPLLSIVFLFTGALRGFRLRFFFFSLILLAGFLAKIVLLQLMYMFSWTGGGTSPTLIDYERYVGTYLHGWTFLFVGLTAFCLARSKKGLGSLEMATDPPSSVEGEWKIGGRKQIVWIVLTVLLIVSVSSERLFVKNSFLQERRKVVEELDAERPLMTGMKRIELLTQTRDNPLYFLVRLELAPDFHVWNKDWGILPDVPDKADFSRRFARFLLENRVDGVYLLDENQELIRDTYASLFANAAKSNEPNPRIWRVLPDPDTIVRLVPSPANPSSDQTDK